MGICKFFQQGNCRFGQNCRYDHIYGSKFSYHSNTGQQQPAPNSVTDEQLVNQVQSDIQTALRGSQWLLSCYAPIKEKSNFPGITDLSPEEARLFIYEAQSNNNLDQAIAYMNNLFKEARAKYDQLLMKNANITRILRSIYKEEPVVSPFGSGSQDSGFSNNASSIFRSGIQTSPFENNPQSMYSQSNQTFGQNTQSIFQTNDPAKSIFAQANQNAFNNHNANIFAPKPDATAKSLFAQASQSVFATPVQNPSDLFANASQSLLGQQQSQFGQNQQAQFGQNQQTPFIVQKQESPFGQSQQSFGQSQQSLGQSQQSFGQSQQSLFGQSKATNVVPESESKKNVFGMGQNIFQQAAAVDVNIYSTMEELSSEDIAAYQSEDFKLGFVPELPPPKVLCF